MNRRLRSLDTCKWVGENKIVLFDPRISLDDQNFKIDKIESLFRSKESLGDLVKRLN